MQNKFYCLYKDEHLNKNIWIVFFLVKRLAWINI